MRMRPTATTPVMTSGRRTPIDASDNCSHRSMISSTRIAIVQSTSCSGIAMLRGGAPQPLRRVIGRQAKGLQATHVAAL